MGKRYSGREGFSLIEVIVAVAILAILSVPILLYFTNSAVHTAQGRHEQSADMAAQTVIEEVDSIRGADSIEGALRLNGWKDKEDTETPEDPSESGETSGDSKPKLTRMIHMDDDYYYYADLTIDYDYYDPGSTDNHIDENTTSKFNAYGSPRFQDLYSDSSVVISEKQGCFNDALKNLYYEFNGETLDDQEELTDPSEDPDHTDEKVSMDLIRENIKRVIKVSFFPYDDSSYMVKGSYIFYASIDSGGENLKRSTEIPLKNTRVSKDEFSDIYFLFMPRYGTGELYGTEVQQDVILDFPTMTSDEQKKININFVRQKIPMYVIEDSDTDELKSQKEALNAAAEVDNGLNYKLSVSSGLDWNSDGDTDYSSQNYSWCNYYSDVEYTETGALVEDKPYVTLQGVVETETGSLTGEMSKGLISRKRGNRIAAITVEIYEARPETDGDGNPVTDSEGNAIINRIESDSPLATNTTTKTL